MEILDKPKFNIVDSVDTTIDIIKRWSPRKCETEKDYENSLHEYLHKRLGEVQITKQAAIGSRAKADLMVGTKVLIDIRKDLQSTAQFLRLISQLTGYKAWEGCVVVLLVGKSDRNLKKRLDQFVNEQSSVLDEAGEGKKFAVFEK